MINGPPSAGKACVLQQGANKGGGKIGLFDSGFGSVSLARIAAGSSSVLRLSAGLAFGLVLETS